MPGVQYGWFKIQQPSFKSDLTEYLFLFNLKMNWYALGRHGVDIR